MKFDITIHIHNHTDADPRIIPLLERIMVKQTEIATRLEAIDTGMTTLSTLVGKVKGETESILAEITTAKEDASPEVVAALEKVESRLVGVSTGLGEVDALVTDIGPVTPPDDGGSGGTEVP